MRGLVGALMVATMAGPLVGRTDVPRSSQQLPVSNSNQFEPSSSTASNSAQRWGFPADLNPYNPNALNRQLLGGVPNFDPCFAAELTSILNATGRGVTRAVMSSASSSVWDKSLEGAARSLSAFSGGQAVCGEAVWIPPADIGCSAVRDGNGMFSEVEFGNLMADATGARDVYACQKDVINNIQIQMACVKTQGEYLQKQIELIRRDLQAKLQEDQRNQRVLKEMEEDRKAQQAEATKIADEMKNSAVGLRTTLDGLRGNDIPSLQNQIAMLNAAKASYEQAKEDRTFELASACLNEPDSTLVPCYKPTKIRGQTIPQPPMSPLENYACKWKARYMMDGNKVSSDENRLTRADTKAGQIAGLVKGLQTFFSREGSLEASSTEALLKNRVSKEFEQFNVGDDGKTMRFFNGQTFTQVITGALQACKARADRQVKTENNISRVPGNLRFSQDGLIDTTDVKAERMLAVKLYEIQRRGENMNSWFSQRLSTYSEAWQRVNVDLKGVGNYRLNIKRCQGARPEVQIGCFRDIASNLEGLLDGSTPAAQTRLVIRGTKTNIYLPGDQTCSGLLDCGEAARNISEDVGREIVRVQRRREEVAQNSRQQVDSFMLAYAQRLQATNEGLHKQIARMEAMMGGMSFGDKFKFGGLKLRPVDVENFEVDQDGVYMMPASGKLSGVIGGRMDPPLMDLSNEAMATTLTELSAAFNAAESLRGKSAGAVTQMRKLKDQCINEDIDKIGKQVEDLVQKFGEANCQYVTSVCNDPSTLEDLIADTGRATGNLWQSKITTYLVAGNQICADDRQRQAFENYQESFTQKPAGGAGVGGYGFPGMMGGQMDFDRIFPNAGKCGLYSSQLDQRKNMLQELERKVGSDAAF